MDVINFTIRDRNILNGLRERGKELKLQGKYLKTLVTEMSHLAHNDIVLIKMIGEYTQP